MTSPGGLFDDIYKSPTQQRRGGGLFDDIYTAGETEEEKRRKEEERRRQEAFRGAGTSGTFGGVGLWRRGVTAANVEVQRLAADISGMVGAEETARKLRERAARQQASVGPAVTTGEKAVDILGTMVPAVGTTLIGGAGIRAATALPGLAGRAATTLAGTGGILRSNIAGAAAAAPLLTVPGAISGEQGRSTTQALAEMSQQAGGERGIARRGVEALAQTAPGRVLGDVAADILFGSALEAGARGVMATPRVVRAGGRMAGERLDALARSFGLRGAAPEAAPRAVAPQANDAAQLAEMQARQAATERLMAEPGSPISQAMRQFETFRAGYGPRALELPVRPEAPAAPSVQEAIDAMRQPFVGRARAERILAENAAQVEAGREGYRQTVRGAREAQLGTQAEIAAREAQAAQDALNAPTIAQRSVLERLRERAPGLGIGLAQAGAGAGIGFAAGETPEERAYLATIGAGLAGVPRLGARGGVPSIPQEVRSVGEFGFVRLPETYTPNLALETEHVANVLARTEPTLSRVGARTQETVNGAGLFGGDISPNGILRFAENAPDEELRTAAAVRGLAFGQDQQLWYRKARPAEPNTTAAFVLTGRDFAELPDEAIDAIVTRLRADDALGPFGGATRDGNHLLALNLKRYTGMDDEQFGRAIRRVVDEIGEAYDIDVYPSAYYAEHLDGSADYVRAIGRRPDALRAARTALVDAEPEYLRYAQATGADVEATRREITSRVESLDRLLQEIEPSALQQAFTGGAFDIGGALGTGLRTPAGRQIAAQAGIGAAGYGLSQSEDERLRATGQQMMGLAALSLAYPALKQAGKYGGIRARDALAQTESGRKVLNTLSYDILADPRVKELVEQATTEMARYRAIGQQLAAEARALGPQGDRIVSDLVERESFEQTMSPDDMAAAIAVANRVADAVQGMGREKVGVDLLSPETFAKRERTYLPRRYGRYAGEEAAGAVQPEDFLTTAPQYGQGKTFRIKGEKQRLDLTPEQRLELGEIREASYRIADAFGKGGKDIASARLFKGLSDIPGVIEPRYKAATDEALEARRLRDLARESGDADAARDANQAYLAARQKAAQIAEEFTRGGEYVKLPDTNALGVLRNAVVRKDVADYLNNVPSFSDTRTTWARLFQAWKRIHTVYNPGTHVGNFVSNAAMVHMGGLPVPQQPAYLAKAAQGLKNYDADVKFLTEQGVLERGLPLYGDTPVKGKAQDEAALRALARTTRPETRAALEKQGLKPMGTAEMRARQLGAKVERAYALEDGVYRVALFKKFRADGLDPKAAADQVIKVLPGYDTRSPLLTGLRNTVSPFVLYPAKYIPTALDMIMQHPERWVALAVLWGGLDQMSRRKYEPLEQKDLPPNQRSLGYLVPGRIQVDAIARPAFDALGVQVPAGDKYTFDVARWTPFSALTGSPAPGSIATQISEDIPGILQPGGPIQDIGALMVNRDPFTGEPIIQPGMTAGEKAQAIGGRAASLALPSVASFQIPRVARDIMRGDPAAAALDVMGVVGLRPQVVKPGVQEIREQKKYEEARRRILLEARIELMRNQRPERVDAINEKAFRKLEAAAAKYRKALGYENE